MAEKSKTPPNQAGSNMKRVLELSKLPDGEPVAPRGPIGMGAVPMQKEVDDALSAEKEATAALERAAESAKPAIAARVALKEGEQLAPEHAEALSKLEAAQAACPRAAVEQQATELGYLPQFWKSPADARTGRPRAVAPRPNPKFWIWAGAKAYHQWPIGKELTRGEFLAAVRTAHDHTFR